MNATIKRQRFTDAQVRMFANQCVEMVGSKQGWKFLGSEVQSAIAVARVAHVFASQEETSMFTSKDVQDLIDRMLKALNLSDD